MTLLSITVIVLDWLVALAWLGRAAGWRRGIRLVPDLSRTPAPDASLPMLSVIVPARNEAGGIAATLHSLLRSTGVGLEIIAIDDRSIDVTGEIMEGIAAQMAAAKAPARRHSLRVIHISELPSGWLGKTHAMAAGAARASAEWLLFTDGDVVFASEALGRVLAFAISSSADHLALVPTLSLQGQGESMIGAFLHVMSIWAVRLWRVPDRKARFDVIGVGAFNMIRRPVYDAIGGWEALRMEVIEDLRLGIRVKRAGFSQRAVLGLDLIRVRWVRGAFGIVRLLEKNLFAFFNFRPALLLGSIPVFAVFTIFPLAAAFAGPPAWPATAMMLLAVALVYRGQAKYQPFSAWQAVFFPWAAGVMLFTMARSMIVVLWRGGIVWRGTFHPLSELRKGI